MDKAIYVGFAILDMNKLHMYETYYDTLKPYFGRENLQLHYIDTDGMILSMNTKDIINDLKNLEDIFNFRNLDENHELFSNENKKVIGKFEIETPKKYRTDEFVCLRSKAYSFKCNDNIENKNKKKVFPNPNRSILILKNIKNVCMEKKIKENAKIIFFVQLIMKCIIKK